MPNIATVLKQEITRLARKEAKALTPATRKASAQYRREIEPPENGNADDRQDQQD